MGYPPGCANRHRRRFRDSARRFEPPVRQSDSREWVGARWQVWVSVSSVPRCVPLCKGWGTRARSTRPRPGHGGAQSGHGDTHSGSVIIATIPKRLDAGVQCCAARSGRRRHIAFVDEAFAGEVKVFVLARDSASD
jgi:hypothetical protein